MLLFTDGFDWTTTIADLITYTKWFDRSGFSIGNTTGNLRFGAGSGNYITTADRTLSIRKTLPSNMATGVVGFAFRHDTSVNYKRNLLILWDTTSVVQMGVLMNADGTLSIYRTDHSTILGTSVEAVTGNQWHYFELKWKINNSITSGDVVLYMDGTAIITLATATDTQGTANAYVTHFAFSGNTPTITGGGSGNIFYDDVYLLDLTGTTNNAPLGNARIQTLFPSGNGNTSGFTGSDGNSVNNYQQVDETALSLADYNDGTALNQKDTYNCGDTLAATSTVYAVVINHVSIRTDTDPRSVAPVIRHSGTDYDGANQVLGSSAVVFQQVHETNPGTASGWTKADVDGAEFGLKVTV